jgi:hypothetical protein
MKQDHFADVNKMVPGNLVDDRLADTRKTMGCNVNERAEVLTL